MTKMKEIIFDRSLSRARKGLKLAMALLLALTLFPTLILHAQPASPNIILLLADDLGWSSTSIGIDPDIPDSKSDYFETPNIDRLARDGMRFTHAYAPAAICSPTRRSLQFGRTPARLGDETFRDNYNPAKNPGLLTIPGMLKSINPSYKTAHYGKWDLRAGIVPEDLGYDESDGDTGNKNGNMSGETGDKWDTIYVNEDSKKSFSLSARAVDFMERQVRDGNPFFLQVSYYATHVDIQTSKEALEKFRNKPSGKKHHVAGWAGMLFDLDAAIGTILNKAENLGIMSNTYIVVMTDNGSVEFMPQIPSTEKLLHPSMFDKPMRNYPLRGGKWTLYEGGIRVPLIIKGPGVAKGMVCREPVGGWDFLPTFAEIAGYGKPLPENLDGGSFAELLHEGGKGKVHRKNDYFVFHRYHKVYPHSAIIKGDYKLIKFWKTGAIELYDLRNDPGETKNIASQHPARTSVLLDLLNGYLKEVNPALLDEMMAYKPLGFKR